MAILVYTATRFLIAGHETGDLIELAIKMKDAVRSRAPRKYVRRSSGGGMETIYEGADTQWALDLGPIYAADLPVAKEYAESTAGGEPFDLAIFGDTGMPDSEMAFLTLRRTDQNYEFVKLRRSYDQSREIYSLRISAIEA